MSHSFEKSHRSGLLIRCVILLFAGALLVSCARVDDKAATREKVPGASDPYPKLSTVPKRPVPRLSPEDVAREKQALEKTETRAKREGEELRKATDDAQVLRNDKTSKQ